MRVLGIDPGSQSTGFGIIEGDELGCRVLGFGTIKPGRRLAFHFKLHEIRKRLDGVISGYAPEEVAIESPFYAQNIKTALALGQVRGAVLVAVAERGRPLFEYSALEIKKAVTGYGRAEKQQVGTMVRALLKMGAEPLEPDASDALAAAYCHLSMRLYGKRIGEANGGKR